MCISLISQSSIPWPLFLLFFLVWFLFLCLSLTCFLTHLLCLSFIFSLSLSTHTKIFLHMSMCKLRARKWLVDCISNIWTWLGIMCCILKLPKMCKEIITDCGALEITQNSEADNLSQSPYWFSNIGFTSYNFFEHIS